MYIWQLGINSYIVGCKFFNAVVSVKPLYELIVT